MKRLIVIPICLCLWSGLAFAQTSSVIQGKVVDESGEPLPGVTILLESSSMQGVRNSVTRINGSFLFRLLPPGEYSLTATMTGMQTAKQVIQLGLGQTSKPTITLTPENTSEVMVVTAATDPVLDTTTVSAHFDKDFVDKIASNRGQASVALLSPGATLGSTGNVAISGAPTHANSYLVNGVESRFDNLRGGPANAVIEDAIQETTVMTSAISAEFGNFGGGVINSVTKSGGNQFSGSFRSAFTNEDWRARTPFELDNNVAREDSIDQAYTITLGGPIVKDRLWFFVAGYSEDEEISSNFRTPEALPDSVAIAYGLQPGQTVPSVRAIPGRGSEDRRIEFKLTGKLTEGHDLIASYLKREQTDLNNGTRPLDESALWPSREIPREGFSLNYRGIFTENFTVDVLYSDRESVFKARDTSHLTGDTRITGTQIRDAETAGITGAGVFLGKPDEPRGNKTLHLKASYFWLTGNSGSHDMVFGFEDFSDSRMADNRQAFNDWRFRTDVFFEPGSLVPTPIYSPTSANGRYRTRLEYFPIENPSIGSDLAVRSLYINDSWQYNDRWAFNIGLRYHDREAKGEDGSLLSDDTALSPRLSAEFDLDGTGKHKFSASYSHYVNRTPDGADDISTAGSASYARLDYGGPQTTDINVVIDWLNQQYGAGFFFDPLNHPGTQTWLDDLVVNRLFDPAGASQILGDVDPNGGVIPGTMVSPSTLEYRFGYSTRISDRGYLKADLVLREFEDFLVDHTNLQTGRTANGRGDLNAINNDDSAYERNYHAVQLQGQYRLRDNLALIGNYTWSQLYGNINAESTSGVSSTTGTTTIYPEFNSFENRNPSGYLRNDQRHVARLFAVYDLDTSFGSFNFSLTERFESGTPYNQTVSLSLTSGRDVEYGLPARSTSGYVSAPTSTTYYLAPRGSLRGDDMTQTDLGVNWEISLGKIQLFAQFDIFNLFNQANAHRGEFYNTSVSRRDTFNVFTETPVEGVNYTLGSRFGTPNSAAAFQAPRTFRFDLGLRF